MTTIKSFTDLSQSKKLAEILPLESADMKILPFTEMEYRIVPINDIAVCDREDEIPCWSLAALLGALPKIVNNKTLFIETSAALWHVGYRDVYTARTDSLVDACVELILKLHELKML